MTLWSDLLNSVLPPRCPFTGDVVDSAGTVSPAAWSELSFLSEPCCAACGFPFEFAMPSGAGDSLCAACLADRPEFSRARAALAYTDASRDLILGFKHGDRLESVTVMIPWLRQAGASLLDDADIIVPVPLHRWRLLARRYNQAAIIGAALARDRALAFCADALMRTRATPTQGHLNANERQKNVRRAFAAHPNRKTRISGQRVLLIDDVYTTGATVRECTKALLDGGAKDVSVLTLARVVRAARV